MKKLFIVMVLLITSLLTLTVCNRLEENNDTLLALIGLAGGGSQFTKTVALSATTDLIAGPFNEAAFRHYQLLFQPADIAGSGVIRSLSFRYHDDNDQVIGCPHVTVKLGHTSETDLGDVGTSMALNINQGKGAAVTVLNNKTVNIPRGAAGDYFEIPLDAAFNYNGVDNLVVDILRTSACTGEVELMTGIAATPYDGLAYNSVSAAPDNIQEIAQDVHHMKFKFAGGEDKAVALDTLADNSNTITPGVTGRTQMLILASDISGRGVITGMAINPNTVTTATEVSGMTVSIAAVPSTTIELTSTTFNDNYGGTTPVIVTQGLSYNIPAGQPSKAWIPFNNKNFNYDGKSNLLIDISCNVTSGGYAVDYKTISTNRVVSSSFPDATIGTLRLRSFEPVLRFAGGTMDTINASNSIATVFPGSASGRQFMLRASELGSAGIITGISLRAYTLTTAVAYPNYSIILAHTTQDVLVADDATNIAGGTVVYSGTFTMPAGLLSGDWIDFKFTTPFRYNGYNNLVVQTSTSGSGTTSQNCRISTVATTWFESLWKATGGGSPIDGRGDFRFWIK